MQVQHLVKWTLETKVIPMLRTLVTSALLELWKRLIQPFPACFPECRIKWDGQQVQAPY